MNKDANERDMEELLLGSIFYCFQIGGKSRTTGSDQMAPIYTRPTWTRNIVGILPGNIKGFTHNILEASLLETMIKGWKYEDDICTRRCLPYSVSTIPLTFRASEQCGFLLPSPANDNGMKTANIIRIKELYNILNKTIRHHKTSLVSCVLFSGIFTIVICTRKMIMIVIFLVVDPITCFTLL